ncbi:cytochrome-c oxidase [Paenibacillus sedimenti]|uniref:Cytochrome-c oxidase n=1 Tax=Paenibacillus sedimenti TaxID=2770274 RepID=A0A926KMD8_9BACL|nr:cytochrome-c oxidase [Paenibacillus sedimenti]MBD0380494.1 cytochrome-c oxidase [Paenibacillus sedimenti]
MGKAYLKVAVVYLTLGVLLGLTMGIVQDFRLASVHAHINLLGWVSMAVFGLIYHFYPAAADTKLAKTQFWLHNIGLPLMQGALAIEILTGASALIPIVIAGSLLIIIGVILFAINVFKHVGSASSKKSDRHVSA